MSAFLGRMRIVKILSAAYTICFRRLAYTKPDWRWQLTPSGRFAHRKEYVEEVGIIHGLKVIHYESLDGFRREMGKDVRGHIFVMEKQESTSGEL